jgi:hypothetical protein
MSAEAIKAAASGETEPGTISQAGVTDDAIKAALAKLDPANEDHWTNEGKPAMAAVNALLPTHITRDRLEAVAPDFSRPERPAEGASSSGDAGGAGAGAGSEEPQPPVGDPQSPVGDDPGLSNGGESGEGEIAPVAVEPGSNHSESFEAHVLSRLDALEADQAYLRKTFGWPTKDA